MDFTTESLLKDKQIQKELKEHVLSAIRSIEFKSTFKNRFIKEVQDDLFSHMDDLMDNVWENIRKTFSKHIKENFKVMLIPKKNKK